MLDGIIIILICAMTVVINGVFLPSTSREGGGIIWLKRLDR